MKKLLYVLSVATILLGCQKDQSTAPTPTSPTLVASTSPAYSDGSTSPQLLMGNLNRSITDPDSTNNLLLIKDQYVVSYNNSLDRPNWVSWHLQESDLGLTDRQDDFRPDATLPTGYYQVKPTDYTAADGFDRGHLCPSADRTDSKVNNSATFLMTNIIPQAPALNRGVWQELEAYCRELVEEGNELYIMAGGYGVGATGSQGYKTILATGKVKPPTQCWKVIVVLPKGDNDLTRISTQSTVIAVDMLNAQTVRQGWEDYIVTINDLEKVTHYTFLSSLPVPTQTALKAKKYQLTATTGPPTSTTTTPPTTGTAITPPASATSTPPTTGTVTSPSSATTTPPTTNTTAPPTTTQPTTATVTPPTTVTTTPPVTTTTTPADTGDVKCGIYNGKQLYRGPKGGCYYINSNGNKTYVDRSYCTC